MMRMVIRGMLCLLLTAVMVLSPAGVLSVIPAVDNPARAEAAMIDMSQQNGDFVTVDSVPKGKTSGKINIRLTFHNTMGDDLDNLKIWLANEDDYYDFFEDLYYSEDDDEEEENRDNGEVHIYNSHFPFEADSNTFEKKTVGDIKSGKTKSVSLSFKLRRDLAEGYYQALFHCSADGRSWGDRLIGVNIWVSSSDTEESGEATLHRRDYDLSIGDGQFTPYAAYTEVMNFGVNLTNTGNRRMYDVRVEMQVDADVKKFPFDINDGNYVRKMGDMESGQMVTVPYSMAVREDVDSGFFPIHYLVFYRETEDGEYEEPMDLVFYVRVRGEDDEDKLDKDAGEHDRTKARIVVDSFRTIPEKVYAGQVFELRVRMKNASSNVSASNIMFTFASEEVSGTPVFTSDSGSTSVVVNNLSPGGTADLSMMFLPSPTAEQKSYKMTIKEQYDSPEFKNAAEEVSIAIPVKQEARLSTSTIEVMPDDISVGDESNVMFGINNTGKVQLYNVTVRFEADSVEPVEAYVGNVKPGETGNVDAMLRGAAPTEDDGKVKIIISYEDENGAVTETEKQMILRVEPVEEEEIVPETGGGDITGEAENASGRGKILLGGGALAVLLAAIAAFVIRRRAKRRRAAELEKELDDEIS